MVTNVVSFYGSHSFENKDRKGGGPCAQSGETVRAGWPRCPASPGTDAQILIRVAPSRDVDAYDCAIVF
jgi:hypothetical protein